MNLYTTIILVITVLGRVCRKENSIFLEQYFYLQWLRLAFSEGPNWVGVAPPITWGLKRIQIPKRCVFLYLEFRTMDKIPESQRSWRLRCLHYFNLALNLLSLEIFISVLFFTQNPWVCGLCPASETLNNHKTQSSGKWICFFHQVKRRNAQWLRLALSKGRNTPGVSLL
jgi:hypothetical protein